jgi:hypothetical protein
MRSVIQQTRETHVATAPCNDSEVYDDSSRDAIWLLRHEKMIPFIQRAHFSDRLKYSSVMGMPMD